MGLAAEEQGVGVPMCSDGTAGVGVSVFLAQPCDVFQRELASFPCSNSTDPNAFLPQHYTWWAPLLCVSFSIEHQGMQYFYPNCQQFYLQACYWFVFFFF